MQKGNFAVEITEDDFTLAEAEQLMADVMEAAKTNPTTRDRMGKAIPTVGANLCREFDKGSVDQFDFPSDTRAAFCIGTSKALEWIGFWNPKTRPLSWVVIGLVTLLFGWCLMRLGLRLRRSAVSPI